jgi:hypothetical protein
MAQATQQTSGDSPKVTISSVKNSHPVMGTVLNKAGQMSATPASLHKPLCH